MLITYYINNNIGFKYFAEFKKVIAFLYTLINTAILENTTYLIIIIIAIAPAFYILNATTNTFEPAANSIKNKPSGFYKLIKT